MSVEGRLGPKKHRRAEAAVGEPLAMAIATHDGWVECVTPDDRHIYWHRAAGEVEAAGDDDVIHYWGCPSEVAAREVMAQEDRGRTGQ